MPKYRRPRMPAVPASVLDLLGCHSCDASPEARRTNGFGIRKLAMSAPARLVFPRRPARDQPLLMVDGAWQFGAVVSVVRA